MKLLNPLIVFEIDDMQFIIGVIILRELFKFAPHVVVLKLLNKEQRIIIIKQLMKIERGVFIIFVALEKIKLKILVILKVCISSGFLEFIPISSRSFFTSSGIFSSILSKFKFLYCSSRIF